MLSKVNSKCEDSAYHAHTTRGTTIKTVPVSSWSEGSNDFFQSVKISQEQLSKQIMIIQRTGNISAEGKRILQNIGATIAEIKHVVRLYTMRSSFEKYLEKYIEARNRTEGSMMELSVLLSTFNGSGVDEIPIKIKTKCKDICESVERTLFRTGMNFNNMAAWSMLIQPSVLGNYSWFSFQKQGRPYPRSPWHQYISVNECADISQLAQEALDKVKTTVSLGIVDDEGMVSELEKVATLLAPDMKLNQEGVLECFPALTEYIVSNEVDDRADSSIPSMDDLDFLTKWHEKGGKKVDITEDVFHDAKDNITGPKATSAKKVHDDVPEDKVLPGEKRKEEVGDRMTAWRRELNLNVGSTNSEDDRDSIDSDRSSTVGPGASPAKLIKYAEKKISKHKRQMKRCTGQESLLTLKSQIKDSLRKIDAYGDPDDEDLQALYDRIDNMLDTVDDKLDAKKQREVNQRQLPRGKLMTWNGEVDSFLDFRNQMKKMLNYDIEELNLSTLKGQIVGPLKAEVLSILYNVKDMKEAWRLLDMEYGDVLVVLPRLRAKLDALPDLPVEEEVEKDSIQEILNYCKTAIMNGAKEQLGPMFIQTYREKLSRENRRILVKEKVMTTDEFIEKLEEFKSTALTICRTSKQKPKKKVFNNEGRVGEGGKKPLACYVCQDRHTVYKCPLVLNEQNQDKLVSALKNKNICPGCLQKHRPSVKACQENLKKYKCPNHHVNFLCCKCKRSNKVEDADTGNNGTQGLGAPGIINCMSRINSTVLGQVGFDTERGFIKNRRGVKKKVLISYDGFASHSSVDESIRAELDLPLEDIGIINVFCYGGSVTEQGYKTKAELCPLDGGSGGVMMDFMVSKNPQELPRYTYNVPNKWVKKHGLKEHTKSASGTNTIIIGKDRADLFPVIIEAENGIALSRSKLTGNILVSGKAIHVEDRNIRSNCQVFTRGSIAHPAQISADILQNKSVACTADITGMISTDIIDIPPIKRCVRCQGCSSCRKVYKPDAVRQEAQSEVIKECIKLDEKNGYYVASYPHNQLLPQLPENREAVKKMMISLEKKLIKHNLVDAFNARVAEDIKTGVLLTSCVGLEGLQESFIPLTYSLKNDPLSTTKLRICTNGSFRRSPGCVSYNDTLIQGPEYLNGIDGILLRWRAASTCALADIKSCYHKIRSTKEEKSLRRLWLKPVLGLGSDEEWTEGCLGRVSFGDSLGGAVAGTAIFDVADTCMSDKAAQCVREDSFMDDLLILEYFDSFSVDDLVKEVDGALKQKDLEVKSWTRTGDTVSGVKFLNYGYDPHTDMISLRPRVNWSPKRRGARIADDVKSMDELMEHMATYPLTKRSLASLVMGCLYDPLGMGITYNNNIKAIYREATRRANLDWEDPIPEDLQGKLTVALSFFLELNTVLFPRRAVYMEAKLIEFLVFFDGSSNDFVGASVLVRNVFENGEEICRILINKSKLVGNSILTAPRAEMMACLISSRLYCLVMESLQTFLGLYTGTVVFSIHGDSEIVLNQIKKDAYLFKLWAAVRIDEIQSNTACGKYPLHWYFVPTEENYADILTRPFYQPPTSLPWAQNMSVPAHRKEVNCISIGKLPDTDAKNIIHQNVSVIGEGGPSLSDLQILMYYHRAKQEVRVQSKGGANIIKAMLERQSRYPVALNALARMLMWKSGNILHCQKKAEIKIFTLFQAECMEYIATFRGNGFYTAVSPEGIHMVVGRNTYAGNTDMKLVPPRTLLYSRIIHWFHSRYHRFASAGYIRTQLQVSGYYLPQALKNLKSIQDKCSFCRRRIKKRLHTMMGTVPEKRLTMTAPFLNMQMDLAGPFKSREFVSSRATRKIYLLVGICDYSRYISVSVVESLSKEHLLNSMQQHFLRFGRAQRVECDFASNFSSSKEAVEEDVVTDEAIEFMKKRLTSNGTKLVQRSPRAAFLQGSAEHGVKCIKRIIPSKYTMNVFQWVFATEEIMSLVNARPVGLSSTLTSLSPSCLVPVWSGLPPQPSLEGCAEVITKFRDEFHALWFETYWSTVVRQKKWINTDYKLSIGDICLIADLLNSYGYPTLALVHDIENDSYETARYYTMMYRKKPGVKPSTVKRTAQSLILVQEGQGQPQLPADGGAEESESAATTQQAADHLDTPVWHTTAGQTFDTGIDHLKYVQLENISDSMQRKKLKVRFDTGLNQIKNMKK